MEWAIGVVQGIILVAFPVACYVARREFKALKERMDIFDGQFRPYPKNTPEAVADAKAGVPAKPFRIRTWNEDAVVAEAK